MQRGACDVGDEVLFTVDVVKGNPQARDVRLLQLRPPAASFLGRVASISRQENLGAIVCAETLALYGKDVGFRGVQVGALDVGDAVFFKVEVDVQGNPEARSVQLQSAGASIVPIALALAPERASACTQAWFRGRVKCFEQQRNFGFISCAEAHQIYGKDVWLHGNQREDCGVGDEVLFTVDIVEGKPQARNLRLQSRLAA